MPSPANQVDGSGTSVTVIENVAGNIVKVSVFSSVQENPGVPVKSVLVVKL